MLLQPNGLRYPRVGGTRQRHFDGVNFKPRKLLENAATPTRRVHAVLGALAERKTPSLKKNDLAKQKLLLIEKPICQRTKLARTLTKENKTIEVAVILLGFPISNGDANHG